MSFEDRSTTACGCAEAIELGAQADARIAELEAENAKLLQLIRDIKADCVNRYDLSLAKPIRARIQAVVGEAD